MKQDWKPRFLIKVGMPDLETGCMEWLGAVQRSTGYGRFGLNRDLPAVRMAHRVAYEYWVGPIPEGMDIDHLCRNRLCVNPDHLEPKTRRDNLLAPGSLSIAAKRSVVTHCPQGHEYTDENTRMKWNGSRCCRACDAVHSKRFYDRMKAGVI